MGLNVVQYPISTSNHNSIPNIVEGLTVVQYPISTSNHNWLFLFNRFTKLYSIQFLHQITTKMFVSKSFGALYSIQFLHQITTIWHIGILFETLYSIQFLHQITTVPATSLIVDGCIVSNFYIKSQRLPKKIRLAPVVQYPISTSNHNLWTPQNKRRSVVQYPISTSNHN